MGSSYSHASAVPTATTGSGSAQQEVATVPARRRMAGSTRRKGEEGERGLDDGGLERGASTVDGKVGRPPLQRRFPHLPRQL
jgi:hypothetical protein